THYTNYTFAPYVKPQQAIISQVTLYYCFMRSHSPSPPPPSSPSLSFVMSGLRSHEIVHPNAAYSVASPPVVTGSVTVAGPSKVVPSVRSCLYIILRPSPVSNSSDLINFIAGSSSSYIPSKVNCFLTDITSVSGVPSPS